MSHFKMTTDESQLLADVGKLYLFVWRTRGIAPDTPLPKDLSFEYSQILEAYDRVTSTVDPHTYVNRLLKDILRRIERDLKSLDRHHPISSSVKKGLITQVECSCGEVTKYKLPLKLLSDFNCPKEHHNENQRQRARNRA